MLESVLRAHVVDDPETPPNFSIHEGSSRLEGTRPMYRVYRGCVHLATSPSPARAVAVVVGFLDSQIPSTDGSSALLELDAIAFVNDEAAVLAPWFVRYKHPTADVGLRRYGVHMLERFSVLVDTNRHELVVPAPRLTLDIAVSPNWEAPSPVAAMTPAARLPIVGWLFDGSDEPAPVSRGEAIAQAMAIAYRRRTATQNLYSLATLVGGLTRFVALPTADMPRMAREMLNDRAPG